MSKEVIQCPMVPEETSKSLGCDKTCWKCQSSIKQTTRNNTQILVNGRWQYEDDYNRGITYE